MNKYFKFSKLNTLKLFYFFLLNKLTIQYYNIMKDKNVKNL